MQALVFDGELSCLPDAIRDEVRAWHRALAPLLEAMPDGGLLRAMADVSAGMGTSRSTALRKYYALRDEGAIGLVNWAKAPKVHKLPPAFLDHWRKVCEDNQRNCKQAYKILIHHWRHTDAEIPGYTTPPKASRGGVPRGWTYGNLMRFAPSKFERKVARIGRSAAADLRPLVLTTRVGLECGQFYLFDDLEHDVKVNFVGVNRQALRPLELCALDLFSACKVAYGLKPTVEGDDGAKQKIKERDMRFLLAYLLTQIGYRRAGTALVVEHGTAAIREDIERILFDQTAGAITVQRSGIEGAPALHGWYEGRGKGNFRFKAALESHHNLTHNVTAALPGQMGLNRDHSPEELHGREKANKLLLKACESLAPEKVALLRFPFVQFHQFHAILDDIYRFINARHEHELEGFEAAGLVAQEYRLATTEKRWLPGETLSKLSTEQQDAVLALIQQPGLSRCRKLAPVEVWEQGRRGLVKLPVWCVPDILGHDLAIERKVGADGLFCFEDRELAAAPFRYLARAMNRDGYEVLLRDGETYQTFVNPFALDQLVVCDVRGGYIGTCRRLESVRKDDPEKLYKAMGDAAHTEVVRLGEYRARHAGEVEQKVEDERFNKLILAGKAITAKEKQIEARIQGETGDLSDIYGGANETKKEAEEDDALAAAAERMDDIF